MTRVVTLPDHLTDLYAAYIDVLNRAAWSELPEYLQVPVIHNDHILDIDGYKALIPPNTHFTIASTVGSVEQREIAVRLKITVDEKRIREHVFYRYGEDWKVEEVWSIWEEVANGEGV
jgi:predicted ester cyclase